MKLTQTDHNEQSLRMDKETMFLIREAFGAMLDNQVGTIEMRDRALQLKRMLEDPDREDKPAVFQRSHGQMVICPDCVGTRFQRSDNDVRDGEVEYVACKTCKGDGQLYQEVIRKMYIPTEYQRKKLSK
jgi:hypothetical protein